MAVMQLERNPTAMPGKTPPSAATSIVPMESRYSGILRTPVNHTRKMFSANPIKNRYSVGFENVLLCIYDYAVLHINKIDKTRQF